MDLEPLTCNDEMAHKMHFPFQSNPNFEYVGRGGAGGVVQGIQSHS